jgi:nucleotide-binding universal stress UspA family protein
LAIVYIKMLSKILVGVDGSQPAKKALEYASNLASTNGSELYIVHTTEEFGDSVHVQRLEKHGSYVNEVRRHSKILLSECESRAKELGVAKICTLQKEGNAAEKILEIAHEKGVDTIVVGSRGLSAAKEFLLGSVSHKLSHHAKCTVVIVR